MDHQTRYDPSTREHTGEEEDERVLPEAENNDGAKMTSESTRHLCLQCLPLVLADIVTFPYLMGRCPRTFPELETPGRSCGSDRSVLCLPLSPFMKSAHLSYSQGSGRIFSALVYPSSYLA